MNPVQALKHALKNPLRACSRNTALPRIGPKKIFFVPVLPDRGRQGARDLADQPPTTLTFHGGQAA